jgi:hypothetical protein
MNGSSTLAWRKYEAAVDRLRTISKHLEADKRGETIDKIQIAHTREMLPGVAEVAKAIGEMIRADMPRYIEGVIAKAQADVRAEADALVSEIKSDLNSKFMTRAKNGG